MKSSNRTFPASSRDLQIIQKVPQSIGYLMDQQTPKEKLHQNKKMNLETSLNDSRCKALKPSKTAAT